MVARRRGGVLNVASTAGLMPGSTRPVSSTSEVMFSWIIARSAASSRSTAKRPWPPTHGISAEQVVADLLGGDAVRRAELVRRCGQLVGAAGDQDQVVPVSGREPGQLEADAAGGARHEGERAGR